MEGIRRPFQGVTNVVLFNWHFYVLAVTVTLITLVLGGFWNSYVLILLGVLVLVATSTSLMAIVLRIRCFGPLCFRLAR